VKRCPTCGTEYSDDTSFCTQDRAALLPFEGEEDTEQVEHVVCRGLAHWPQKRYATAEEFGRAGTEVPGKRAQHLTELPPVAADATRVAMPDVLPPTKDSPLGSEDALWAPEVRRLSGGAFGDTGMAPAVVDSPDLRSIDEAILALQDSMFAVPGGRRSYRLWASRIFEQRTLPDSLRIRAALTVAAGHIADGELREARKWSVRASHLIPESDEAMRVTVKAQIDRLAGPRP
jgi:hypothetical protein